MQFPLFTNIPNFHHALSTRENGVSRGEWAARNLAFHVGDDPESVRHNRALWAREVDFDPARLVAAQQSHGKNMTVVGETDAGRGALDWESALPRCDALITADAGVPLLILVADCAPVLLVDPTKRVCAVVHAGWRGALAGIAGRAVAVMTREFGTKPRDVLAAIGPCLNTENLEVGEEVAARVEAVHVPAIVRAGWEKPHLDLRALIVDDLTRHGVGANRIEVSPLCPRDRNDLFFSHRGQNGQAGRFGLVAW